jgi:fructose-1,6-bisphosphatase/inositol monophosphatase family enzyme
MSTKLQIAIDAARAGAAKAQEYFLTDIDIKTKPDSSVVTIADHDSEKVIIDIIRKAEPDASFIAEETGGDMEQTTCWIIDPIDGTRTFTRGLNTWCVLVAYYENSQPLIGVCYFPVLDTILYAEKGQGAFVDDKKVQVSKINNLKEAYLGYGSLRHFRNKQIVLDLTDASASSRSPDATYAAYLVGCGKLDVMIDGYAQPWDVGPFATIIPEAGGKITNLKGEDLTLKDRGYIATNGILHDQVLTIVNKNQ